MQDVIVTTQVFREDDQFVSYCPQFNVSSLGDTPEAALTSLQEALSPFLRECHHLGTLHEVLEEAGFHVTVRPRNGHRETLEPWLPPVPIVSRRMEVAFA